MKRAGAAPLFVIAGILVAVAGMATLLGLDAAAEKQASADRFAVLLGAGFGTVAFALAAVTFFLFEVQRRLAARRMVTVQLLHDVIAELAEALITRTAPEVQQPVLAQRSPQPRARTRRRVSDDEPVLKVEQRRASPRARTRKSG